ncbi:MAG TPA: 16S rRNA (uracil(1498)-N(3))-methyltransferase [Candidatus Sulfotelmatobacter sp.]|jgi:16S rRNA (uracil1498-N3)-methyltransferase|nr:16S rRNA (uracil(1498)-N(3))-methyltransferase [Candidatus Sulfotelmatobacter sp.]
MDQPLKLRLFTEAPLAAGSAVVLGPDQAHYLCNVMRAQQGAALALFNGRDGEWRATLAEAGKKKALLAIETQIRPQQSEPDLWLIFAPVKRARIDFIAEKATELGVSVLQPVFTKHTVMSRVNDDRLRAIAVEAAEQCERLSVPEVRDPLSLDALLADWPADRCLILLDEGGGGRPVAEALASLPPGPAAVLVGPEGGFAKTELDALRTLSFAVPVGLGPRILRADTAVVAALSCFQAVCGDWRRPPRAKSSTN